MNLNLPKMIYAVPDIETNIYFDNIVNVINPKNYIFDVHCLKGVLQAERWTYTPSPDDVGEYSLTLNMLDQSNKIVVSGNSTIKVVPSNAGQSKSLTMLSMGDSLTANFEYLQHVMDLCTKENGPEIKLIGSRTRGMIKHEGYGGWTAKRFVSHYTGIARGGDYKECGSPFLYKEEGSPELDFRRYCEEFNNGKAPDVVTIFLGANDLFFPEDDTIDNAINEMLGHYDTLIKMIKQHNSETVIAILLPIPPAASQDAFGANYGCLQTRWQYKRNQNRMVELMLNKYGSCQDKKIYIVPTNVNLDCVHSFPTLEVACHARTSEKMVRQSNGVHPALPGNKQIGDTLYCWLKGHLYEGD